MSDNTSFVKTPPMGWNSWDCYGAAVNEETVRANAKFMAENLKQFGWQYIVVDIQWSNPIAQNHEYQPFTELCMDEYSRLIPAAERFPSAAGGKGFAPLAEYVHSLGLKFGIHIMRGIPRQAVHRNTAIKGTSRTARDIAKTSSICQWNTDMYGVDPEKEGAREYYDSIFELYKSWGVDFIKVDDICRELPHEESELVMLSESLRSCGRDMVLSLSPGAALLKRRSFTSRSATCGASPTISGTTGRSSSICSAAHKHGAFMRARGTSPTRTCSPSALYSRITVPTAGLNSQRSSRSR